MLRANKRARWVRVVVSDLVAYEMQYRADGWSADRLAAWLRELVEDARGAAGELGISAEFFQSELEREAPHLVHLLETGEISSNAPRRPRPVDEAGTEQTDEARSFALEISAESASPAAPSIPSEDRCPSCKSPMHAQARFCAICGHRVIGSKHERSKPPPAAFQPPSKAFIPYLRLFVGSPEILVEAARLANEQRLRWEDFLAILEREAPDLAKQIMLEISTISTPRPPSGPGVPSTPSPRPAVESLAEEGSRTAVETASRTILAAHRLGRIAATNMLALETLQQSARVLIDAEHEHADVDARAKRQKAAFDATQAIHDALLTRLGKALPSRSPRAGRVRQLLRQTTIRQDWLARIPQHGRSENATRGLQSFRKLLEHGLEPSLAVIGGWIREEWRIEPEDVAAELQTVLGVPYGLERDVHVAGEVRIILAHCVSYERDVTRSLDHADGIVVRVQVGELSRIDVPNASIDWLHWLSACLLERTERDRPRLPSMR